MFATADSLVNKNFALVSSSHIQTLILDCVETGNLLSIFAQH